MCEPTTLLMTAMAVSGGIQAYGQYQQGVATKKYYNSVAEAQEKQAELEYQRGERQTTLIQDSAKYKGKNQAQRAMMVSSSQRAAMAANGIDLSSVTMQDIASDTMDKAKMDELAIRYDADINSWNTMEDAKYKKWALRVQAGQSRQTGSNALSSAKTQMWSTIGSTAVSIAGAGLLKDSGFKPEGGSNWPGSKAFR
ncbi:MAG: hypothetical protein EOM59_12945 [Clostridia bacterium]|nr:hypothetical protein [Clostridia bacterium]